MTIEARALLTHWLPLRIPRPHSIIAKRPQKPGGPAVPSVQSSWDGRVDWLLAAEEQQWNFFFLRFLYLQPPPGT